MQYIFITVLLFVFFQLRCLEIFLYCIKEDQEKIPIHKKLIEFDLVNEKKNVPDPPTPVSRK